MKLYVTSDIHLEFGDIDFTNDDNVDVLILGGDICVAVDIGRPDSGNIFEGARSRRVRDFFLRCSQRFPRTILIMGNHEHYHGDFAKSQNILQNMLDQAGISNIHILEKSTVDINGYLFIGGTLWTDFNDRDKSTMSHAEYFMSDYRSVKNTNDKKIWKFIPKHALEDHEKMVEYIATVLAERRAQGRHDRRVVVVGHHCPSRLSTHPRYAKETLMNGCYSSELDTFILDHPEIQLWTHGHTHEDFDYMIGSTRIVCNPRGYINYESRANGWKPKLVELE